MLLFLESTGKFKIQYAYGDLSEANLVKTKKICVKKYLGIDD
ncbi:MAG: hypothetical protein E6274_07245 [Clostridium sp.]|nr:MULTISPECIES: hypothetical protein [Clostridium]MDU7252110.1 hypothetical protein [Clostridium sp.]